MREALQRAGRADLIGHGPDCLVPPASDDALTAPGTDGALCDGFALAAPTTQRRGTPAYARPLARRDPTPQGGSVD